MDGIAVLCRPDMTGSAARAEDSNFKGFRVGARLRCTSSGEGLRD